VDWATETGVISAEQLAGAPWLAALMVAGLLVGFALLLMMLSGVLAIVRFHGYTLIDDDERFRAEFGLLDAREKTLRKSKLHSLQLVQTAIGRLVDNWHVIGHQTGASEVQQQSGAGDKRFLIPGIDAGRRCEVAGALRQEAWRMPELNGVDKRMRTFFWTRLCAPLLGVAAALQWAAGTMHWPAPALAGLTVMLAGIMHLRWRRWGWVLEGERLTVRSGLVGQSWLVFDLDRCQQVRVTASPYQRRHGLATVHLRLPHGEQSIPYLPQETAAALANRALLSAERSLSHAL
jgi:putative membrane protein